MPLPPGAAAPANVGSVRSSVYSWSSCLSVQAIYTPLRPIKISFLHSWLKLFILVLLCLSSQTKPFHFRGSVWSFLLFCVSQYHFHRCKGQKKKRKRYSEISKSCTYVGWVDVFAISPAYPSCLNQLVTCCLACFLPVTITHSSLGYEFLLNSFTPSKN